MKILKIVLKFIGILIIIAIVGGIGIMLTKANEKQMSTNAEDESRLEQMQEQAEIIEQEEQEEIPEIQEVQETKNQEVVADNKISSTEQKANSSTNNKQQSQSTSTQTVSNNQPTTPSNNIPGGVENNSNTPATCTATKHGTDVGTSKQGALGWYNTKAQAEAVYYAKVDEGSSKWGSYQITTAEYDRDYPSSYEVWDCTVCHKWTVNFLYKDL